MIMTLYPWPTSLSKGSYALQVLVTGLWRQDQHRWVGAAQLIVVLVHQHAGKWWWSVKFGSTLLSNETNRLLNWLPWRILMSCSQCSSPCSPESVDRTSVLWVLMWTLRQMDHGSVVCALVWRKLTRLCKHQQHWKAALPIPGQIRQETFSDSQSISMMQLCQHQITNRSCPFQSRILDEQQLFNSPQFFSNLIKNHQIS